MGNSWLISIISKDDLVIDNDDDNNGGGDDGDDGDDGDGGNDVDDEHDCDGDRLIGSHYIRFHWVKYFSKTSSRSNLLNVDLQQLLISAQFDQNSIDFLNLWLLA